VGSNTGQCQHYDGDRKLPDHQPKEDPVLLVLLWKKEHHVGGDFGRFAIKVDLIIPSKRTVQLQRLWKN
jgi:hypothetical protein